MKFIWRLRLFILDAVELGVPRKYKERVYLCRLLHYLTCILQFQNIPATYESFLHCAFATRRLLHYLMCILQFQKIPATYESFLRCAFATLAAIIVNCIGTPYFLLAALPVCVLYFLMQKFYTATARSVYV